MTDPVPDPPADADNGPITFGAIRQMIADALGKKDKEEPPKPPLTGQPPATDLAAEVKKELAKIQDSERATNEKQTIQQQIAAITDKLAEKPPVERSRVHRLMGWGEPHEKQ